MWRLIISITIGLGIGLQNLAKAELLKAYRQTTSEQWFVGALTASPLCWHGVYKGENYYIETAFNILNPGDMAARQYSILPSSAYPQSAALARLQWFNPNTVLRRRGEQLISSDLRMGEFGIYPFEFIIMPEKDSGQQLPMYTKTMTALWQADSINPAAERYAKRNNELSFPKYKWLQFMHCLTGGS